MRTWALALVSLLMGCPSEWRPPSEADSHEDPMKLRPGYGNDTLHTWWPLTDVEVTAVQGIDKARAGDAHALFALAIFASATVRDAERYARYTQRLDRFIDDARAGIEGSKDDWHRGDTLNRSMHRVFFTGTRNKSDPEIGAYELDQARLTGIFDEGHYNCISSALLYTVVALAFSLPVRGVMLPTHAFVELDPEGQDKRIDVETTTEDGFDRVHDEKFYAEAAAKWSSSRGLKPMTFDDYKKREIVPPYALVARAMQDKRVNNDDTQGRLSEVAAMLEPENPELVHNRMASYENEAKWLFEHKASRTTVRMMEIVAPVVSDIAARFGNTKLMSNVVWMAWYDAQALLVIGRGDEAAAIADDALDHIQPTWDDAKSLRNNFIGIIDDRMLELNTKGEHEKSIAVVKRHVTDCMANSACLNNLYVAFDNWSTKYQAAGDAANAKKVLQSCIELVAGDTRCRAALETLSGH
jgi:hypothetical protein